MEIKVYRIVLKVIFAVFLVLPIGWTHGAIVRDEFWGIVIFGSIALYMILYILFKPIKKK